MKRQELYNPKQDRGSGNIGAANVGEKASGILDVRVNCPVRPSADFSLKL